ncbi:MAG: 23S rRNA (guanosine(2251)-2'-O)-methyltransferase RlmB [Spirochaetaceae bacterium]|nr:23S rRNA (guanosine(2251)-2'-O)-methyltransferase RlmB [Spirochaetaceae bacterium]
MKTYLTGANGVAEAIKRGRGILYISRKAGRAASLAELAAKHGVTVKNVSSDDILRLIPGIEHRGYALETDSPAGVSRIRSLEDLWPTVGENALVMLLDGITDPRNLGAVMRAADQFGADAVVVPRRRSAGADADTLSRSSAGAVEWVPLIEVTNMARALEEFKKKGFWIWGADMDGEASSKVNLKGKTALVMGREGEGLHQLVKDGCDGLIRIPTGGRLDSLNVATAAGILMYESRRQQGFPYSGN